MALFRTISSPEPLPPITGDGVVLRTPQMGDFAQWAALRERSRTFLTPWEPIWPSDDLTRPAYRQRLRRYAEELRLHVAAREHVQGPRGEDADRHRVDHIHVRSGHDDGRDTEAGPLREIEPHVFPSL